MHIKIETNPRPITDENKDTMRSSLKEAITVYAETANIQTLILMHLQGIRHYKVANKNVATVLKTKMPDVYASVGDSYGTTYLSISWGTHNYNFPRRYELRFHKGDSVQQLIAAIEADIYPVQRLDSAKRQLACFARILEGEATMRQLAKDYEAKQKEIKLEIFGKLENAYFLEPLRPFLSALCSG